MKIPSPLLERYIGHVFNLMYTPLLSHTRPQLASATEHRGSPSPTILPSRTLQIHHDLHRRIPRHDQYQIHIIRRIHRLMIRIRRHINEIARTNLLLNLQTLARCKNNPSPLTT